MAREIELSVDRTFAAAHAIRIRGQMEPLHGHHWHLTVTVSGPELDEDGLLCDFHLLERLIDDEIIARYHNRNLNEIEPFSNDVNPTAELVCREIARRLEPLVAGEVDRSNSRGDVRLTAIRLTEAPGCAILMRF